MAEINPKIGEKTQFRAGDEQAVTARQGGIASGAARRAKRSLRECLERLCSLPLSKEDEQKLREFYKRKNLRGLTVDDRLMSVLVCRAMKGDMQAMRLVCQLRGELVERKDITTDGDKLSREPLTIEVVDSRALVEQEDAAE